MTSGFTTGLQALQDAIGDAEKRAAAAKSGGTGSSLGYISWKNGDKKIVRFLTDDILVENFYDFIVDKTGSTKTFLVDPSDPDRLKKYMSPTPGLGWRKNFGTGALEEPTTRKLGVGVAVVRDEVRVDGKMVLEDALSDKVVDETTYPARQFGIIQQSVTNFWHTLATSCFKRYGTICDRDYEITREGEGFKTKYSIIPLEPVEELSSIQAVQEFYFYGQPWDSADPQRFLKCPQTLQEWAQYFSGEERYKFWLTPDDETPAWLRAGATLASSASTEGLGEFHRDTTHNDEAQASAPAGTSFGSIRDTLLNSNKK